MVNGRKIAILMTNGTVKANAGTMIDATISTSSGNGRNTKPALGEMWRAFDVHIILDPMEETLDIDDNHHHQQQQQLKRINNTRNRTGLGACVNMVACVGLSTSLLESATNKNYVSLEQRRVSTPQHVLVLVVPRAERRE